MSTLRQMRLPTLQGYAFLMPLPILTTEWRYQFVFNYLFCASSLVVDVRQAGANGDAACLGTADGHLTSERAMKE
jgi:hypothetical protein